GRGVQVLRGPFERGDGGGDGDLAAYRGAGLEPRPGVPVSGPPCGPISRAKPSGPRRTAVSPGATRDDVYAHWRFVDTLFGEALDVEPDERAAFLERACRGDTGLRHEVEGLLAAHVAAEHFLDEPTDWFEVPPLPEPSVGEQAGTASREGQRIGTYRLVERLGEGGMGTVWLAERADGQFEQRVALKLVRAGLDSVGLRRRFRRERQILARLNHPHIARLLDGGVVTGPTGDEQPYLVMEFVDGEPITAYCDRRRLLTEARLGLFCQVAEAVQYAHHNLVI